MAFIRVGRRSDRLPRLDGIHVLVVEDDDDARMLITEALRYLGAIVSAAPGGRVALADLEQFRPSVIVTDLAMPQVDGLALIRAVRAHPDERTRKTPVISVTAYDERYRRDEVLAVGANEYLRKPLDLDSLCTLVDRYVRRPPGRESAN